MVHDERIFFMDGHGDVSQILSTHPGDAVYIADTENHRVLRFGHLELFSKGCYL